MTTPEYIGTITVHTGREGTVYTRTLSANEVIGILIHEMDAEEVTDAELDAAIGEAAKPGRPPRRVLQIEEDPEDKAPKKRVDKAMIERLLKDSDLSIAEIAEKAGCSKALVYIVKTRMRQGV